MGPGSACRNGTQTGFAVNPAATSKHLVIYMKGGAACFNASTCASGNLAFGEAELDAYLPALHPLLDRQRPENPLADYDLVLVPECTGDVYWGSNPNGSVDNVDGPQRFVGFMNYALCL